jgi:hypothetical protein
MPRTNPRALAIVAALLAVAACGKRETPAERVVIPSSLPEPQSPAPVPPFDPIGTWTVTGFSIPGISAVTDAEAKAHDGQTVVLAPTEALSNGETCAEPRYPARAVDTEGFLATEFNLPPESLKPVSGKDLITVVEVSCADAAWTAFGSLLIVIDGDHVLAPWDGAFYELARARKSGE